MSTCVKIAGKLSSLSAVFILAAVILMPTRDGYAQDKFLIAISQKAPPSSAIKEILQYAYHNIGIAIEFEELPAKRSIVFADDGRADAEAFRVRGIDQHYTNLVLVDAPLRFDNMHLYVKKGREFQVEGFLSIPEEYSIGYKQGLLFVEFAAKEHRLESCEFMSVKQIALHLDSGRSDVAILGANEASIFDELGIADIVRLEPPIYQTVLYHYVHKRHAHIVPKLEEAIIKMREKGLLEEINKLKP